MCVIEELLLSCTAVYVSSASKSLPSQLVLVHAARLVYCYMLEFSIPDCTLHHRLYCCWGHCC